MLNEEHLLSADSPHLTKVAPDFPPRSNQEADSYESKSVNDELPSKILTTDEDGIASCPQSHSVSQPCSLGPTRTNSFVAQQRPRVESFTTRIRAGSLDTPSTPAEQQPHHHHASCSVGSADRKQMRTPASAHSGGPLSSPFRPISLPPSSCSPIFASVTLPVYVFDCPLTSLVSQLLSRGTTRKENVCRDHTFREENASSNGFTGGREGDSRPLSGFDDHSAPSSSSLNTLSQYCSVIEAVYCKCLGQALFTSLQMGQTIHSRDVEAAMDLCKETLLEIDITSFIQNICGHLKDFKMKAGIEMLRHRQSSSFSSMTAAVSSSSTSAEPDEEETNKWHFPLSLLRLHQPCANLRHLHKLIRTRFQEILCLSFKPVPSLFDYYFYCPPDRPNSPAPNGPEAAAISPGLDDTEVCAFDIDLIGLVIKHSNFVFDQSQIVEFHRSYDHDNSSSRSCSALDGSDSSSESIDDVELEGEGESESEEVPPIPLFLHLTATIRRNKKDVASQSLDALPTCLGDLLGCLSSKNLFIFLK